MTLTYATSVTTTPARPVLAPVLAPALEARPDQAQLWLAHRDPVSFDTARETIRAAERADGTRTDHMLALQTASFDALDTRTMALTPIVDTHLPPLALRKHAFAQLASRLAVPAPYVASLPASLQRACINYALTMLCDRDPVLLRLAGDEVRAIMSEHYAPMDNGTLLDIVDGALTRAGLRHDAQVRSTVHGPHTVLRITIPSEGVAVRRDDVIEYGLDIGNSELGLRSVQVTPVTYRLICTNGMRAWRSEAATRLRHAGNPRRLRDSIVAVVPAALAEAKGDLQRWRKSVDVQISDALEEIENLRRFDLTVGERRAVGRRLAQLPENTSAEKLNDTLKNHRTTAFDLANAITETARDRTDVSARLALEEVGHRYLARVAS